MSDTLRTRVRQKLLRQIAEDGGELDEASVTDDPRLTALSADLAALDDAADGDPVIEDLASRYWVP